MSGAHHHHHHHRPASGGAEERALTGALVLILAFMAGEVTAGILASSLALLSDAAHMVTDAAALAMAVAAARLARRPAGGSFTFGYGRSEILSAQANGAMLGVLACFVVFGAITRLVSPPRVDGAVVVVVALVGVMVNLAATRMVAGPGRRSLNVEGAYRHLLTDLAAFGLTAVAGAVVLLTGWRRADGVAALAVAAIMLWAAYGLLRDSGRVLMEGSPDSMAPETIGRAMARAPGVIEVHDLHVWTLSTDFPSLSAHVIVGAGTDCHGIRAELQALLAERFSITHTTLQVEHAHQHLLSIESP